MELEIDISDIIAQKLCYKAVGDAACKGFDPHKQKYDTLTCSGIKQEGRPPLRTYKSEAVAIRNYRKMLKGYLKRGRVVYFRCLPQINKTEDGRYYVYSRLSAYG